MLKSCNLIPSILNPTCAVLLQIWVFEQSSGQVDASQWLGPIRSLTSTQSQCQLFGMRMLQSNGFAMPTGAHGFSGYFVQASSHWHISPQLQLNLTTFQCKRIGRQFPTLPKGKLQCRPCSFGHTACRRGQKWVEAGAQTSQPHPGSPDVQMSYVISRGRLS